MRPPQNLNGDGRWTHIIPNNDYVDSELNARVVRLKDEPPEIGDFDSDVLRTQMVSMDTHFSAETP